MILELLLVIAYDITVKDCQNVKLANPTIIVNDARLLYSTSID